MNPTRILLVEDDDAMRNLLRRSLERAGYFVHESINGQDALHQLSGKTFDLVITDILMPESEGLELTFNLRRSHPYLPILTISGGGHLAPQMYLKMARSAGASASLAKPFTIEELLGQVDSLLKGGNFTHSSEAASP